MKKTTRLRKLLNSKNLEFLMEAHNGLSAKIVEKAGFKGIWASGLSISAALGVRDNNEASWTQVLEVLEFMSDAVQIPILLDGDTGYGNFNNARRLVKKLEQRGIAGVCIEDKLFPKTNSFIQGENQPLADIMEFSGKIKAMKDSQLDKDFSVIARVEAFIAGWGLDEAIKRAEAYRKAGADAILIHSKRTDSKEIEEFMKEWGDRHPVIIVPTKYYSIPTEKFERLGVRVIIWANHNLRSAITAMEKTSNQILKDKSLINVEDKIASVGEVFRLQGAEELKEAEKKYFPIENKKVNGIILAASQGELHELTENIPKTLVRINGKSILEKIVENFNKNGVKDIAVIRGFEKDKINYSGIEAIDNDQYASTQELYSLYLAKDNLQGNTIISYGDIIFKNYILNELLNDQNDITLIVDAEYQIEGKNKDFVQADTSYSKSLFTEEVKLIQMESTLSKDKIDGEFIGLWKVNEKGASIVKSAVEELANKKDFNKMTLADLFNYINISHPIGIRYIKGSWIDVDTIIDLQKAGGLF